MFSSVPVEFTLQYMRFLPATNYLTSIYLMSPQLVTYPLHPPQPSPQIKSAITQVSHIADKFEDITKVIDGAHYYSRRYS